MAEKIEIELLIKPDGTVEMVTHGLKGATCLSETESIEKAIGKPVHREKTREYYEGATAVSKVNTGR